MSGIKTKINGIRHILTQDPFHVICIQESWLNESVTNEEIISGTKYEIIRNDRSSFQSNRKNGGGVLMLVHQSLKHTQINIDIPTILEIQIAEIILPADKIIIVNVYVQPSRARTVQNKELLRIIANIKTEYPDHGLIIVGDFNTPTVNWIMQPDGMNIITNEAHLPPIESRLCNIMHMHLLNQMNNISNSRGSYLDHIWSDLTLNDISSVPQHLKLDNDSIYHRAIMFKYQFFNQKISADVFTPLVLDFSTTKLNETRFALLDLKYDEITTCDGAQYYVKDEKAILYKIESFTNTIRDVQNSFTKLKKRNPSSPTNQPWTNDSKYRKLISIKKLAKRSFDVLPTLENKNLLRIAHINAFARYNILKNEFYDRVLQNHHSSMDFYNLMKSKISTRAPLPPMLVFNDAKYFGEDRFQILAKQLHSNFAISELKLCTTYHTSTTIESTFIDL